MDEPRRYSPLAIAGPIAALLLVATLYVTGYFALSQSLYGPATGERIRLFYPHWLRIIYEPAARVETVVTGKRVHVR